MKRRILATALFIPALGMLTACGTMLEPQFVTFKYQRKVMTAAEQAAVSNALASGQVTLPDLRVASSPVCQFASNKQAINSILDVDVNGPPATGQSMIVLDADNFFQGSRDPSSALNPASQICPPGVSGGEIWTLNIETDSNIGLGQPVLGSGIATVVIGGEDFTSENLYFAFELTSYDGDYTTGNFGFLAKNIDNQNDNRVVVVYDGVFGLDD